MFHPAISTPLPLSVQKSICNKRVKLNTGTHDFIFGEHVALYILKDQRYSESKLSFEDTGKTAGLVRDSDGP